MTWEIPWVIAGVDEIPLATARTMAYVTTAGREGVIASDHLRVTQTGTASGSIVVAPGVLVANNKFNNASFESYVGRNSSSSVTTSVPATGGTSRVDLIYAHITDPGQSGHYPTEPTVAAAVETRVITNVNPAITRVQDHPGYEHQSGLALARISRPANTTTVQTAHITDLRVLLETATSPLGQVTMYAGGTVPFGWLFCQGQEVSRVTYASLFNVLGTTFGAGNSTTTFNLPDFRGRGPIGVGTGDASGATAQALGQKKGKETHAFTVAEMAAHAHTVDNGGNHGHTASASATDVNHLHTFSVGGGGHEHVFQQNNSRVVTGGGAATVSDYSFFNASTGGGGAHTHSGTTDAADRSLTHTHGITVDAGGVHSHTMQNTGGGTPASLLQPSTVVNFIIKAY